MKMRIDEIIEATRTVVWDRTLGAVGSSAGFRIMPAQQRDSAEERGDTGQDKSAPPERFRDNDDVRACLNADFSGSMIVRTAMAIDDHLLQLNGLAPDAAEMVCEMLLNGIELGRLDADRDTDFVAAYAVAAPRRNGARKNRLIYERRSEAAISALVAYARSEAERLKKNPLDVRLREDDGDLRAAIRKAVIDAGCPNPGAGFPGRTAFAPLKAAARARLSKDAVD